jgi:hypothetical protein
LTKLSLALTIINNELGDGFTQDWTLRLIATEKLRWSDDSGSFGERSFQEVHQRLDRSHNVTSDASDSEAFEATPVTPVIANRGGGDEIGD